MKTVTLAWISAVLLAAPALAQSRLARLDAQPARIALAAGYGALEAAHPAPRLALEPARDKTAWKRSLIAVAASQALDAASSYGMRELNPLLASPEERFGARAISIKLGATATIVVVESLIVKKYPGAARLLSRLNWSSAALTAGFAAHNFAIR